MPLALFFVFHWCSHQIPAQQQPMSHFLNGVGRAGDQGDLRSDGVAQLHLIRDVGERPYHDVLGIRTLQALMVHVHAMRTRNHRVHHTLMMVVVGLLVDGHSRGGDEEHDGGRDEEEHDADPMPTAVGMYFRAALIRTVDTMDEAR